MFSSISKATPQTQRTTGFIANRAMTIVPITPFTITVNGIPSLNPNSVSVNAGDTVTAVITTPDDWLWHAFYEYEIDGVPSSFAVVNKSNYTISVKPEDAIKRWYMYEPTEHTGTYKSAGGTNYPINFGTNYELIPTDYHIVLNPLDNGVYFFDINGIQISRVSLPADPLDYVKIPDRQSVVVLVRGGEAYEVYLNNTTFGIAPFYARLNYSEFTDDNFIFQLPGEDLITYLRRARAKTAIPPATCLAYDGMFVFAGGNGSVWVVDPYADFNLVNEFEIDEFVMNITALPNNTGVVFVTQSQKIYKMDYAGNFTELYQGTTLWQPALFNGKVYIPECQVGLLKVYNPATDSFEADIMLDDFSPSYITVDNGKMYVAGHDSERVLVFDSAMTITEKTFPDKVTLVSALNGTIIASHWMKSFKVLNLDDLRRIVSVEFLSRRGPVSHIGTSAVGVKTLGNDEVFARTPEGTWLWINGQRSYTEDVRGSLLVDGDIISMNRACRVAGLQRTNCIIGDVVYDYDVEAVAQTYYPRNIDLPILPPGDFGIHSRTITLPNFFTPCLMSIEYGVIKVNGAYYYGDRTVTAGDIVSIEMETKNNNILPVFTVGSRQFVVPVSTNVNYAPLVYAHTNTNPLTPLSEEIVFGEFESLFDYIIPGYYNANILKNNTDITGNYFQQFGVGDKLTVNYTSSPKLYDTTDIYILGPTNYKFTAQNTLGTPIEFLDYGNLQYPYTRQLDPYAPGASSYYVDNSYGNAIEYVTPEIQYITANISINGISDPTGNANISISGGDSYFVVDGVITKDINIKVFEGNNLALARNVVSYFDSNVKIIQHLPTGDDDGWADVVVGHWGLINRDITDITEPEQRDSSPINSGSEGIFDVNKNINIIDSAVELSRIVQRTINSSKENLDLDTTGIGLASTLKVDEYQLIVDIAANQIVDYAHALTAPQSRQDINLPNAMVHNLSSSEAYQSRANELTASTVTRDVIRQRTLNAPTLKFDRHSIRTENGYRQIFNESHEIKKTGYVSEFIESAEINIPASRTQWTDQVTQFSFQNYIAKLTQNFRLGLAYLNVRDLPKFLVFFDLIGKNDQPDEPLVIDPYKTIRHEENVENILASTVTPIGMEFWSNIMAATPTISSTEPATHSAPYTATINIENEIYADTAVVDPVGAPTFVANYLTVSKTDINNWIDRDTVWQTNKFFLNPAAGIPARTREVNYYFISDILADKDRFEYFDWEEARPLKTGYEFTDVTPSAPVAEIPGGTQARINFERLEFLRSSYDLIDMIPDTEDNQNYLNIDMIPLVSHNVDTSVNQVFMKIDVSDTLANTLADRYSSGLPAFVKPTLNKFVLGLGAEVDLVADKAVIQPIPLKPIYETFQLAERQFKTHAWSKEEPIHLFFDIISADANPLNLIPSKVPAESNTLNLIPSMVPAEPNVLSSVSVKEIFDKENSIRGTSAIVNAAAGPLDTHIVSGAVPETTTLAFDIYIKPVWAQEEYSIEPFVVYRLQHEEQKNIDPQEKIVMEREKPQFYFTAITLPEINQGIVWDHDISVEYGAFVTEDDAILAAASYTSFRPYLILDTNLWTYRVLFDTNLVCPLPSGRYAIAWLIRGG